MKIPTKYCMDCGNKMVYRPMLTIHECHTNGCNSDFEPLTPRDIEHPIKKFVRRYESIFALLGLIIMAMFGLAFTLFILIILPSWLS